MKTVMVVFALLAVGQVANAGGFGLGSTLTNAFQSAGSAVMAQINATISEIQKLTPANLQSLTDSGLGQVFQVLV